LAARADCPACAASLEFELRASELATAPEWPRGNPPFQVEAEGVRLRLRCPDSRDLALAAAAPDVAAALRTLRERCIVAADSGHGRAAVDELPESVLEQAARLIAERDPQADLAVELRCPGCGEVWRMPFDIVAFFLEEIGGEARRLLLEVATLARAYGWREADILAMSPARRHLYLQMAG
jgi:hypothetical protein